MCGLRLVTLGVYGCMHIRLLVRLLHSMACPALALLKPNPSSDQRWLPCTPAAVDLCATIAANSSCTGKHLLAGHSKRPQQQLASALTELVQVEEQVGAQQPDSKAHQEGHRKEWQCFRVGHQLAHTLPEWQPDMVPCTQRDMKFRAAQYGGSLQTSPTTAALTQCIPNRSEAAKSLQLQATPSQTPFLTDRMQSAVLLT